MESHRDSAAESAETSDPADLPSDFFDDFTKDEFIDNLNVIDSWEDDENRPRTSRITASEIENVRDLRELIGDEDRGRRDKESFSNSGDRSREYDHELSNRKRSLEQNEKSRLDEFIKPGSRRDPRKTIKAIKKDKEEKVKEYLDKVLDGIEDIRPPGTELDDYYKEHKSKERRTIWGDQELTEKPSQKELPFSETKLHQVRRRSPRWSPKHPGNRHWQDSRSPNRSSRFNPHQRYSPHHRYSPRQRYSPRHHYSPHQSSPLQSKHRRYSPGRPSRQSPRQSTRRSPRRLARRSPEWQPRHSPRRLNRSRSPYRREYNRRYPRSPIKNDNFLYPANTSSVIPEPDSHLMAQQNFSITVPSGDYAGTIGQPYQQDQFYSTGYGNVDYGFGIQQQIIPAALPQPVPAPMLNAVQAPLNPAVAPVMNQASLQPAMVPPPLQPITAPVMSNTTDQSVVTPYDALAQLVAEGKLSKEDYLKLAPNKGVASNLDNKARVGVLSRCDAALKRLTKLVLPNRLMMNCNIIESPEMKSITPKFCSPLKRNATIEFHFTKGSECAVAQHNKQLVDSIIATVGLDKVVAKHKKKYLKNMKDAACQTSKPYCDVCEIRESTKCNDVGTFIDHNDFSSSVHTQVVEQDLVNSKAVFNPSGSVADGAPISISHLTPAQLVSQLAARAKTFKQTPDPRPSSSQFSRRHPPNNYDYDGRGGQQYYNNSNNGNYRY